MLGRNASCNAAAAQTAVNLAETVQGNASNIPQRAIEEEIREGDAADEESGEQDGLHSGFIGQRRAGSGRARLESAVWGSASSRPARQIGCMNPHRWGSCSKDETGTQKRKHTDQRERVKQDLTFRLAACLRSNSRAEQRVGSSSAAESVDLDEWEWE